MLLPLAALALACGSVPQNHYYVLAPPLQEDGEGDPPAAEPAAGPRLGVETFAVDPPYDQDRLVYRVGRESGKVGFYDHHRWAAAPGRLAATAIAAGLRGLPGLAAVEPATVNGSYTHLLAGRVISIEEIDLPGGRQLARVQLDLKLLNAADDTVVWTRLVSAEAGGEAADVSDVMRQMQAAFGKVVEEIRADLARVLGEKPH